MVLDRRSVLFKEYSNQSQRFIVKAVQHTRCLFIFFDSIRNIGQGDISTFRLIKTFIEPTFNTFVSNRDHTIAIDMHGVPKLFSYRAPMLPLRKMHPWTIISRTISAVTDGCHIARQILISEFLPESYLRIAACHYINGKKERPLWLVLISSTKKGKWDNW